MSVVCLVCWSVVQSVIISKKCGKLHFHAPIRALVYSSTDYHSIGVNNFCIGTCLYVAPYLYTYARKIELTYYFFLFFLLCKPSNEKSFKLNENKICMLRLHTKEIIIFLKEMVPMYAHTCLLSMNKIHRRIEVFHARQT